MSPIVQIPGTEGIGTLGVNGPRVPITKDLAKIFSELVPPGSNPEVQENSVERNLHGDVLDAGRAGRAVMLTEDDEKTEPSSHDKRNPVPLGFMTAVSSNCAGPPSPVRPAAKSGGRAGAAANHSSASSMASSGTPDTVARLLSCVGLSAPSSSARDAIGRHRLERGAGLVRNFEGRVAVCSLLWPFAVGTLLLAEGAGES